MTIKVEVIASSIAEHSGKTLYTVVAEYPRFIHAEVMTHRMLSRNASSSRAIPVKRMIENIQADPAWPSEWRMNEPGMQGFTPAPPSAVRDAENVMSSLMERAIEVAEYLDKAGFHKQHVNRITEPFQHIKVVITASEWNNFFALRIHEMADPTIQELAIKIKDAISTTPPNILALGEWHLPFIDEDTVDMINSLDFSAYMTNLMLCKISAARCARVSYNHFNGKRSTMEDDMALFHKLVGSHPIHASPLEHQATPDVLENLALGIYANSHLHGNLVGWKQFRKMVNDEYVEG